MNAMAQAADAHRGRTPAVTAASPGHGDLSAQEYPLGRDKPACAEQPVRPMRWEPNLPIRGLAPLLLKKERLELHRSDAVMAPLQQKRARDERVDAGHHPRGCRPPQGGYAQAGKGGHRQKQREVLNEDADEKLRLLRSKIVRWHAGRPLGADIAGVCPSPREKIGYHLKIRLRTCSRSR